MAYFITFATYGSRLPGDDRGTVSIEQNAYGDPGIGDQPGLAGYARKIQAQLRRFILRGDNHMHVVRSHIECER